MHSYIIIHHTYETFEVALFINTIQVGVISDDKRLASKMLIPHLDTLLRENNVPLTALSFIGVNQGPGLFSTLRSIITTANALYFAEKIPLIGVDALDATAHEFYDETHPFSVVLLDAFNHEIYYAIMEYMTIIKKSYNKIDLFLKDLIQHYPSQKIRFIGNGTLIYKDLILDMCKEQAFIPEHIPALCSLEAIARIALHSFVTGQIKNGYLSPLHLKKHPVELL